jgi:sodium/proline symporter
MLLEISTFVIYFALIIGATLLTYHRQKSDTDFVIGDRSLSFWLTALSAHASDMSSWLFMAYPAVIFTQGFFNIWLAIGLIVFMFLNWQFIAPKIRKITGKNNNLTLNAYFESRFDNKTKSLRTTSSVISFFYYLFYICAGLVSLGLLVESLFNLNYTIGITLGLVLVVFYVFLGGYTTVAWIDLFQGFFLLGVILFIPFYIIGDIGSIDPIILAIKQKKLLSSFFPNFSITTIIQVIFICCGWGIGYFGQPHIITKFMGIKNVDDMKKAQYLGVSWQILALFGATLLGLIGIYMFPKGLPNPELIVLEIVKISLIPFFSGLVLCAILAATTNVIAAQILVVASSLAEDFYKRLFHKKATNKELLKVSRLSVILTAIIAYAIAFNKPSSIYKLVLYAWSGLGAAFGPLLLISLYYKKITKKAAFAGILSGGICASIWPFINSLFEFDIPQLIPSFILSCIFIFVISFFTQKNYKCNDTNISIKY